MRKKMIILLLCLGLLVILLGTYVVLKNNNKEISETAESTETIQVTKLESADITAVSLLIGGEEKKFSRQEEEWKLEGDENFPLDETKINTIVNKCSALTAQRKLEDVEDLSEYGLEQPSNCVTISVSDGTETKIYVGDKNTTTGNTYLYLNNQKKVVYIVSVDFTSVVPASLMGMAVGEDFPTITSTNIEQIIIQNRDNDISIKKNTDSGEWSVSGDGGAEYTAESQTVSTLQSTITGLQFKDFVDYSGENMGIYGLDHPAATIKVKYTETEEQTSDSDGEDPAGTSQTEGSEEESGTTTVEKELILYVGGKDETGDYYVKVEGSSEVHTMSSDSIDEILGKTAEEYWSLVIGSVPVDSITGLSVTYQGVTNEILRDSAKSQEDDGSETTTVTYSCNGQEIDKTTFETFYNKLIAVTAQSKEEGLSSTEKPAMKAVFHTEQGDKVITFTPYDENFYLAQDIEGRFGLVGKTNVKELFSAYEALQLG